MERWDSHVKKPHLWHTRAAIPPPGKHDGFSCRNFMTMDRKSKASQEKAESSSISQKRQNQIRSEIAEEHRTKGLLNLFKQNLKNWDGALAGKSDHADLKDTLGSTMGPIWCAVKEVQELVGESKNSDNSLLGSIQKTLAERIVFGKAVGAVAAKAIPVVGQVLAAGMAVKDACSGWNDNEMQKQAFGFNAGQEATTGQKPSAALANALDMDGLVSGLGGMLGFNFTPLDVNDQ